jgi:purine-nucleoside phosphorylase
LSDGGDERSRVETLAAALRERFGAPPDLTVVLGSGWRDRAASLLVAAASADLRTLPGWPTPSVEGHGGELRVGAVGDRRVALVTGRVHAYEGFGAAELVRGLRACAAWGSGAALLLNAAGSLDPGLPPGSLMPCADHLNLGLPNPLAAGASPDGRPQFQDLVGLYDAAWRARLLAREPELRAGIYAGLPGPSYETPAEIRALHGLGADAVGMSTIPEAIAARAAGMRVMAISLISNLAAGLVPGGPSHAEVLRTASAHAARAAEVLRAAILECPRRQS